MSAPILYAKVGGPPADWAGLRVFDLDTGLEVERVEECDVTQGWAVRIQLDSQGRPVVDPFRFGEVVRERLRGRFEIRRVG